MILYARVRMTADFVRRFFFRETPRLLCIPSKKLKSDIVHGSPIPKNKIKKLAALAKNL